MKTYRFVRSLYSSLAILLLTLGLTACGGSSSSSGDNHGTNDPGDWESEPNATDGISTATNLGEIHGLTGDANQDHRLFYVDASHDNGQTGSGKSADAWLMAYNPETEFNEVVDKKLATLGSVNSAISPLALHEADIDVNSGEIKNYKITSVTYVKEDWHQLSPGTGMFFPEALMRVDIADGSMPTQVTDESGMSADLGFIPLHSIVAFNLNDAKKAEYAFPSDDSTTANRKYRLTTMDADSSTPVNDFKAGLNVQTPLFKAQGTGAGSANGWLVVDQNKNDCLAFVPNDHITDATCIPNADGTGNVMLEQDGDNPSSFISGVYPLNNGAVLALPDMNTTNPLQVDTTLWFYEQGSSGSAGRLHLLKNTNGESLKTSALPMFGPDEAGRVVSKGGDTLYLAASDGGIGSIFGGGGPSNPLDMEFHVFVFKITTSPGNIGWQQLYHKGGNLMDDNDEAAFLGEFLIDTGSRLIFEVNDRLVSLSLDGQDEKLLDGRANDGGNSMLGTGAFQTSIGAVSQGGWFYYNRELNNSDYATAIKVDGSKRVELKNCTWIGASTSGVAKYSGGNFSSLEPSEVFMACNNKQLAAVDANNPEAGRVMLGSLTEAAEKIAMGRTAPGPHRLMQVVYADERYEVIYVNTREKDSLKHLMANVADQETVGNLAGLTAPVSGF